MLKLKITDSFTNCCLFAPSSSPPPPTRGFCMYATCNQWFLRSHEFVRISMYKCLAFQSLIYWRRMCICTQGIIGSLSNMMIHAVLWSIGRDDVHRAVNNDIKPLNIMEFAGKLESFQTDPTNQSCKSHCNFHSQAK